MDNLQIWPPKCKRARTEENLSPPTTPTSVQYQTESSSLISHTPTLNKQIFRNGFVSTPKAPSFSPYVIASSGKSRGKALTFPSSPRVFSMPGLSTNEWNNLAHSHNLLHENEKLHDYQIEGANEILEHKLDICVVAPTGAGKSMLWILPLLAQKSGISLVIVPFTSLGIQGENRHKNTSISGSFLCSTNSSLDVLKRLALCDEMHVVYICPEMLETPKIAEILHSASFQDCLSAVYIDKAHSLYESASWCPSYTCLYLLQRVLGPKTPLIALSATLPKRYRDVLVIYAGFHPEYYLINLGNFVQN
ncbi:P-loop containing nucleoside triphosphate hydrolase protein [Cyathus striatus]|nr:P-loop containing nucleoside triphosphate hydrolase protein [Cyathus striatus]